MNDGGNGVGAGVEVGVAGAAVIPAYSETT